MKSASQLTTLTAAASLVALSAAVSPAWSEQLEVTADGVGIGTTAPERPLHVDFSGSNTAGDGLTILTLLSANNTVESSDAGFALRNVRDGGQWNFRTTNGGSGFAATINGTGGTEFRVLNTTTSFTNTELYLGSGARSVNGQWLDASSRDYKRDIARLDDGEAISALKALKPVTYKFKGDEQGDLNVGFIAEDVPDLVATADRKALNPLEIVALLTSVVQQQQAEIEAQHEVIKQLAAKVDRQSSD